MRVGWRCAGIGEVSAGMESGGWAWGLLYAVFRVWIVRGVRCWGDVCSVSCATGTARGVGGREQRDRAAAWEEAGELGEAGKESFEWRSGSADGGNAWVGWNLHWRVVPGEGGVD